MLKTLLNGSVGPVPICKIRPAPIRSTVDWMWFRISTKICSNVIWNSVHCCSNCSFVIHSFLSVASWTSSCTVQLNWSHHECHLFSQVFFVMLWWTDGLLLSLLNILSAAPLLHDDLRQLLTPFASIKLEFYGTSFPSSILMTSREDPCKHVTNMSGENRAHLMLYIQCFSHF